nr:ribonuclease H-like domain-containing protein [Lachnospiraceae bacterium]
FVACRDKETLVHFNGNTFDLPFLKQRAAHFSLEHPFDEMEGVDIYKRTAPYKGLLGLESCKQKSIEAFLGIDREDEYNGGQLIKVYEDYTKSGDEEAERLLLLHNHDDMIGMLKILPILSYSDVFAHLFKVSRVQANHYTDLDGSERDEVLMKLRFPIAFPKPLSLHKMDCTFSGEGREGFLKVPLYKEEMKFFYANYKDYYYLPEEDTAVHKAIAFCVDKEHRKQAKASNCYTKKEGAFLPQWDIIFEPIFKRDYEDKVCFFELTDEMKKQPEEFRKYAVHILDMLAHAQ